MHWLDRKTSHSVYYRNNLNVDTYFRNLLQEVLSVVDLSVKIKKEKKNQRSEIMGQREKDQAHCSKYFWKEGNDTQNQGKE